MIDQKKFEGWLPILTADTVGILIDNNGWDENEAIRKFMRSKVYAALSDERTMVWHYSPLTLAELFEDESRGELVWPEA